MFKLLLFTESYERHGEGLILLLLAWHGRALSLLVCIWCVDTAGATKFIVRYNLIFPPISLGFEINVRLMNGVVVLSPPYQNPHEDSEVADGFCFVPMDLKGEDGDDGRDENPGKGATAKRARVLEGNAKEVLMISVLVATVQAWCLFRVGCITPLRTAVSIIWGRITQHPTTLSPKQDCTPIWVKHRDSSTVVPVCRTYLYTR